MANFFECTNWTFFLFYKSSDEKEEMLDGAESQNYGYGYGTKESVKQNLPFVKIYSS